MISMATHLLLGNAVHTAYFFFLCNFEYNLCGPFNKTSRIGNQKYNSITNGSLKSVNFTFFLRQLLADLHEILISGFHGNHCQKKGMLCFVKVFQQV